MLRASRRASATGARAAHGPRGPFPPKAMTSLPLPLGLVGLFPGRRVLAFATVQVRPIVAFRQQAAAVTLAPGPGIHEVTRPVVVLHAVSVGPIALGAFQPGRSGAGHARDSSPNAVTIRRIDVVLVAPHAIAPGPWRIRDTTEAVAGIYRAFGPGRSRIAASRDSRLRGARGSRERPAVAGCMATSAAGVRATTPRAAPVGRCRLRSCCRGGLRPRVRRRPSGRARTARYVR